MPDIDIPFLATLQVFEKYAKYGDAMIGKWLVRDNGQKSPNVRTVFKPLLNMFHGERGSKKWKQAVDTKFKTATSVSELLRDTLHCFPDEVLDAPPKQHPAVDWQPESLPEPAQKKQCVGEADSQRAVEMTKQPLSAEGAMTKQPLKAEGDHDQNGSGNDENDQSHFGNADEDGVNQDKVLLEKGDCSVAASVSA